MSLVVTSILDYDYVVVGGGIAGVTCAEQLYALDEDCSLLLIAGSDFVKTVTNVISLSKTLDLFDVEDQPSEEFQKKYPRVRVIKSFVSGLNSKEKIIYTDGESFKYNKLCICSGAVPNNSFKSNPHVLTIRDTDSVKKLQEKIDKSRRILVVGNGGIASEVVYELTGVDIIWAIRDRSVNSIFLDSGAAEFLTPSLNKDKTHPQSHLRRRKYTVDSSRNESEIPGSALGPNWLASADLWSDAKRNLIIEKETEITKLLNPKEIVGENLQRVFDEIIGDCWPVYSQLSNGKIYGCDAVISATGVVPNIEVFVKGNDFAMGVDGGLSVDEKMRTSIEDIFAAGDVCSAGWELAPHWFQMRLWTQARQMGYYAAKCMWASHKGEELMMDFCFEIFAHATKFFGYKVILLGLFNGQGLKEKYEILLRVTRDHEYVKCVMLNGRMQGALLIGDTDLEETFENLILNQMDLSVYGEDLLDPSVDIEDYFD